MDANAISALFVSLGGLVVALTSILSARSKDQRAELAEAYNKQQELKEENQQLRDENILLHQWSYSMRLVIVNNGLPEPAKPENWKTVMEKTS